MPSIVINEIDLSAGNPVLSDSDIVYVPGLVTNVAGKFSPDTVISQHTPILLTTIEEFEAACGTEPYLFTAAQDYPDGFAIAATPTSGSMYEEGAPDPAYVYARELINAGLPVLYERLNDAATTVTVLFIYNELCGNMWEKLKDKSEYQFKYITTGGYPNFEYSADVSTPGSTIAAKMIDLANARGDACALIDHTNNSERSMVASANTSVYYSITNTESPYKIDSEYASMFTPWFSCTQPSAGRALDMPGSYLYLMSLAKSMRDGNANFLAVAGVNRGVVPNVVLPQTYTPLTMSIADSYQPKSGICINAIANVKPYGYTIWGNRTLMTVGLAGTVAKNFLNVRNMLSDIKKVIYVSALRLMFEPNSDVLKMNFNAAIAPTLDQMVSGGALTDWSIKYNPTSDKTKLSATVNVVPIYPVEDFEIGITITNEEVTVS